MWSVTPVGKCVAPSDLLQAVNKIFQWIVADACTYNRCTIWVYMMVYPVYILKMYSFLEDSFKKSRPWHHEHSSLIPVVTPWTCGLYKFSLSSSTQDNTFTPCMMSVWASSCFCTFSARCVTPDDSLSLSVQSSVPMIYSTPWHLLSAHSLP